MAVEYLQGELQRVTRTIDLQESLVNGCADEFAGPHGAGEAKIDDLKSGNRVIAENGTEA